jgi:hypothetical protein
MSRLHVHTDPSSYLCQEADCDVMVAEARRRHYERSVALVAASLPPLGGAVVFVASSHAWSAAFVAAVLAAGFAVLLYRQLCGYGDVSLER